ncbi:MAG: DUF2442 domain-containing protein [Sumerlaeia bacterium]
MKTNASLSPTSLAANCSATANCLELHLKDGASVSIPWAECSTRLASASDAERAAMELSPGGYGIHWPLIDEDLSIPRLLESIGHQSE